VIFFLNMNDRIIFGLSHHHHLRRFALALRDMYFALFILNKCDCGVAMCILVMQRPDVMLKLLK
jgi:hypothetical protein